MLITRHKVMLISVHGQKSYKTLFRFRKPICASLFIEMMNSVKLMWATNILLIDCFWHFLNLKNRKPLYDEYSFRFYRFFGKYEWVKENEDD